MNKALDSFPHYMRITIQLLFIQPKDTVLSYLMAFYWGVKIKGKCTFVGLPKFRRPPGAFISIKSNSRFLSRYSSNLHGLNHPCMICALTRTARIEIGESVGMSGVTLACAENINIGDRVLIGANTIVSDTNSHELNYKHRFPSYFNVAPSDYHEPVATAPIFIERDVFIGMTCIILKGAFIGSGSIVSAGSVVRGSFPSNTLIAGNPARVVKKLVFEDSE